MSDMRWSVLTRDGNWIAENSRVPRDAAAAVSDDDAQCLLLPLATYLAQPQATSHGVWLAPTDDPDALSPHLHNVPLIAIDFPLFTDGRGYSIASTLRNRDRFTGDLRAIGDVLIDQLFFLRRVGFSSFALRADQDRGLAVKALQTFSDAYQGAADQTLPAFRRRARPNASELST